MRRFYEFNKYNIFLYSLKATARTGYLEGLLVENGQNMKGKY